MCFENVNVAIVTKKDDGYVELVSEPLFRCIKCQTVAKSVRKVDSPVHNYITGLLDTAEPPTTITVDLNTITGRMKPLLKRI